MGRAGEAETRLEVPAAFTLPDLARVEGVASVQACRRRLRTTYWDSPDLALLRSGMSLRHRLGEGRPTWTLTQEEPLGEPRDVTVPGPGTRVPVTLSAQLVARLRGAGLQPVAELRTSRTCRVLLADDGLELAEVVDDSVVVHGGTGESWREVEVLHRADDDVAARTLVLLLAQGATVADPVGAVRRAVVVRDDPPPPEARPAVRPVDAAGRLARSLLLDAQDLVIRYDEGVRRGEDDAVHQLRVTSRRLRSQLRTFGELLDDARIGPLREGLRWLGEELAAARDLEVLRERLHDRAQESDPAVDVSAVDEVLQEQHRKAVDAGLAAMSSARYVEVISLLHEVAADPHLAPVARRRARKALPPLVRLEWKRLRRAVRRLRMSSTDEEWHQARIRAKRARYAAEALTDVLGRPWGKVARRARRAQQLLGEHQDAVVAADWFGRLGRERSDLGEVCEELVRRELAHAGRRRKQLRRKRSGLRLA